MKACWRWAGALCLVAGASSAGAYDGLYRPAGPAGDGWSCLAKHVGMDGGAMAVGEGRFLGVESSCELTNPVAVRGMAATLFDAVCSGEGESYSYRMMLMKTATGIAFVHDGFAISFERCN